MSNRILYGKHTKSSLLCFPFDYPLTHREFYYAIVMVKKASAYANYKSGKITKEQSEKIIFACDEILKGKYDDQMVISGIHGGAGTSVNMNVNEVIANLSGTHPNDHVNASQSTNDVNPSALKIALIKLSKELLGNLDYLIKEIEKKAEQNKDVKKLARTHMQDAVPTTLGAEFQSYADILKRDKRRIEEAMIYLYDLNLGGSAVGNSINVSKLFISEVFISLRKITGIDKLKPLSNLMSGTSSASDFCYISAAVTVLCNSLSKIASDFRFLSSGPLGSIGEISFEELQQGSSIMPGKVNPVMAELMNQIYYLTVGKNMSIHEASQGAQLELGVMLPVIVDSLITMFKTVSTAMKVFADLGIKKIIVNKERCLELLERSMAYSTLLTPKLGYDTVSEVVKEAIASKKTLRQVVLEKKLLTEDEFDKLTGFFNDETEN